MSQPKALTPPSRIQAGCCRLISGGLQPRLANATCMRDDPGLYLARAESNPSDQASLPGQPLMVTGLPLRAGSVPSSSSRGPRDAAEIWFPDISPCLAARDFAVNAGLVCANHTQNPCVRNRKFDLRKKSFAQLLQRAGCQVRLVAEAARSREAPPAANFAKHNKQLHGQRKSA